MSGFSGLKGNSAAQGRLRRNIAYGTLSKTRKLLRRLPDDLTQPIKDAMRDGANAILEEAKYNVLAQGLYDKGNLFDALTVRFGRDGLSARVGLATKAAIRKGFYGKFHEYGTKGGSVTRADGTQRKIPALPARPFLGPAFDANREAMVAAVEAAIKRAINRAAGIETSVNSTTAGAGVGE